MKGDSAAEPTSTKIKQLRDRLNDVVAKDEKFSDDFYLHRWLIQNGFKVEQTEQAIRESIKWRKEKDIEILAEQAWGFGCLGLAQDFPVTDDGVSKSGQPIVTIDGGDIDFRVLMKKYGRETLLRYYFQLYVKLERLLINSHKNHLNKGGTFDANDILRNSTCAPIIISNYKNLSVLNATSLEVISALVEGAKIGMKHFPCLVSAVTIINTNKFSALLFKTLKPIFATSPYYVVDCYDTDKKKWAKAVLDRVDANQLTATFGGSRNESYE